MEFDIVSIKLLDTIEPFLITNSHKQTQEILILIIKYDIIMFIVLDYALQCESFESYN